MKVRLARNSLAEILVLRMFLRPAFLLRWICERTKSSGANAGQILVTADRWLQVEAVVFTGKNDGRFIALDSTNGDSLWEFQTGAGVNAPASVFSHNGQQYVVVYSAGNLFARSPPGDSVWLFSLNGTLGEVASPLHTVVTDVVLDGADAAAGAEPFARKCAQCHGTEGEGGHGGGPPLTRQLGADYLVSIVTNGGADMPAFGTPAVGVPLAANDIRDIVVFLLENISQKN